MKGTMFPSMNSSSRQIQTTSFTSLMRTVPTKRSLGRFDSTSTAPFHLRLDLVLIRHSILGARNLATVESLTCSPHLETLQNFGLEEPELLTVISPTPTTPFSPNSISPSP